MKDIRELTQEQVSDLWPDVYYKGNCCFGFYDDHYMLKAMGEHLPSEQQECYLGYDKNNDKFIVGFDVWLDDEDATFKNVLTFSCDSAGNLHHFAPHGDYGRMFYNDAYQSLHDEFPNLIDLRLD